MRGILRISQPKRATVFIPRSAVLTTPVMPDISITPVQVLPAPTMVFTLPIVTAAQAVLLFMASIPPTAMASQFRVTTYQAAAGLALASKGRQTEPAPRLQCMAPLLAIATLAMPDI